MKLTTIPEPIVYRCGSSEVHVIPSAHNELAFGEVCAAAMRGPRGKAAGAEGPAVDSASGQYDVIAVELGATLPVESFAAAAARLYPATGVAVTIDGNPLGRETIPVDANGNDGEVENRPVVRASIIPLCPGDSILEAIRLYWERKTAGDSVELEFIDLPIGGEQRRGGIRITDTWVAMGGLQQFLDIVGDRLQAGRLPEIDDARERYMAARIARIISSKRRCLLVIGAAHWLPIKSLLDAGVAPDAEAQALPPAASATFKVYAVDAASCWAAGWLGTPFVVASSVRNRMKVVPDAFDLPRTVEHMIDRALAQAVKKGISVGAREWLQFKTFLAARTSLDARLTARLDDDLCHAARVAGLDNRFVATLKKLALRYPWEAGPGFPKARFVVRAGDGAGFLVAGSVAIAVAPADGGGERRTLPARPARLTRKQQREADGMAWRRMPHGEDQLQRSLIHCVFRRAQMVHESRRPRQVSSKPFLGDWGRGIDVRRTLLARARGMNDALYVKQPTRRGRASAGRATGDRAATDRSLHAPVAWIFRTFAEREVVSRVFARMEEAISSAYACSMTGDLPGNLTVERVLVGVNYLRGRVAYDKELIRRYLDELPEAQKAGVPPWSDAELTARFDNTADLFVASAVKAAGKRAIVVADHRWEPSRTLVAYAASRGVELVKVAWDSLCSGEIKDRYAYQHTLPSKARYGMIPDWLERLVPPVPEFTERPS